MLSLKVFDRPLCCSTGICGPEVDPALVAFAADLAWLASKGVAVERINPAQEPQRFAADETVRAALREGGNDALPLVLVGGAVVSLGRMPARAELAAWAGVAIESHAELPLVQASCCESGKSGPSTGCC